MATDQTIAKMTFEEAMRALEEVVGKLERGDVPLEESIILYERGAELRKRCEAKLREAEEKISKIKLDTNGQAIGAEPFNEKQ